MTPAEFRAWLDARGLTVREAAPILGRSRAQVQRYRDGTTPVTQHVALAMQAAAQSVEV